MTEQQYRNSLILPGLGLVVSAIAALLGAYFLILAFFAFFPLYDNYVVYGFLWSVGLGLVLLVRGIVGLVVCIT